MFSGLKLFPHSLNLTLQELLFRPQQAVDNTDFISPKKANIILHLESCSRSPDKFNIHSLPGVLLFSSKMLHSVHQLTVNPGILGTGK